MTKPNKLHIDADVNSLSGISFRNLKAGLGVSVNFEGGLMIFFSDLELFKTFTGYCLEATKILPSDKSYTP